MLKHITETSCPVCGNGHIVAEKVNHFNQEISVHTNGTRGESRHFGCGMALEYSPNFRKTYPMQGYECANDPAIAQKCREEINFYRNVITDIEEKTEKGIPYADALIRELENKIDSLEYKLNKIKKPARK